MIGIFLLLFVGYKAFGFIYSEFLYPPKFEIIIVDGNTETTEQFKQFKDNERVIGIENVSKQEFIRNKSKSNRTEIKGTPFISLFKYTSVKTAEVGLETSSVDEAIDYLKEELK